MKLFCDTNVLIDYLARRQPFFQDAMKLRIAAAFEDVELWACAQSFVDAEHVLRRAIPVATLRSMMGACLSFIHIATPSENALVLGLRAEWPDLEDFLIAQCALEQGAHRIVTRDAKGFAASEVPALSLKEFLRYAESELGIVYEDVALVDD